MIIYEDIGNGLIRAKSDRNRYINEYPTKIFDCYEEVTNKGRITNGVGIFDNGRTYRESEKEFENAVDEK